MWWIYNRWKWGKELNYFGSSQRKEILHHFDRIINNQHQDWLTTHSREALLLSFEDICRWYSRMLGKYYSLSLLENVVCIPVFLRLLCVTNDSLLWAPISRLEMVCWDNFCDVMIRWVLVDFPFTIIFHLTFHYDKWWIVNDETTSLDKLGCHSYNKYLLGTCIVLGKKKEKEKEKQCNYVYHL